MIRTNEYDGGVFEFEYFNPLQEEAFSHIIGWKDLLVGAPTASGKTVLAELFCLEAKKRNMKSLYLAPMRSLAYEKLDDWTSQKSPISKAGLKVHALTGESEWNDRDDNILNAADLIVATSEMLDAKSRGLRRRSDGWLNQVGVVIVDEAHLIGVRERGAKLECAIVRFSQQNPNCRWLLLSATVPNMSQLADWMRRLTKRAVEVVTSNYRPCRLEINYSTYASTGSYIKDEKVIASLVKDIILDHPSDQFLVFSGYRNWINILISMLKSCNVEADMHHAGLSREKRKIVEEKFRSNKLRVLVTTTTLAWGVNLPARRVVIAHQYFSPVSSDSMRVPTWDVHQMMGRSGRPKYDKEGTAYLIVRQSDLQSVKTRIESLDDVASQLLEKIHFLVLGEVYSGFIDSVETYGTWYKNSLAALQDVVHEGQTRRTVIEDLERWGFIQSGSKIRITEPGRICASHYLNPEDVQAIFANLAKIKPWLYETDERCDLALALAISMCSSNEDKYVGKDVLEEIPRVRKQFDAIFGGLALSNQVICESMKVLEHVGMNSGENRINNLRRDLSLEMVSNILNAAVDFLIWQGELAGAAFISKAEVRISQKKYTRSVPSWWRGLHIKMPEDLARDSFNHGFRSFRAFYERGEELEKKYAGREYSFQSIRWMAKNRLPIDEVE